MKKTFWEKTATRHLVIVGCGKSKLDRPAPAAELYTGALFQKSAEWARSRGSRWMILSALHGLISPHKRIAPYDLTLSDLTRDERERWAHDAREGIKRARAGSITLLAGAPYEAAVEGLDVALPLHGMQIGERLHWLKEELDEAAPDPEWAPPGGWEAHQREMAELDAANLADPSYAKWLRASDRKMKVLGLVARPLDPHRYQLKLFNPRRR